MPTYVPLVKLITLIQSLFYLLIAVNLFMPYAIRHTCGLSFLRPFFQAVYVFGFGVPLFIDDHETCNRVKWGLWIVHKLLLSAVYGFIFFMHPSKWRERLPGSHVCCTPVTFPPLLCLAAF